MLDDINSELISIYPGTFPTPRPFSRKPLVFNSGFHTYIRPPLPVYRVQCTNDYIAEKSKKAEAAIRKLYKAAATSSSATFKEANTLFQHDLSSEAMLTKYRETQIYSKSRLRKVNRRQLMKAVALAKKKDDDESKKLYDVSISKVDLHATSSKQKLKSRIFGALKLEPKTLRRNRTSSAAEETEKTTKSEPIENIVKPSTYPNSEINGKTEKEQLKPKGPLTLRRPIVAKKPYEIAQKKKPEVSTEAISNSATECLLKEEEGEGRKPLKEGNYTKIVTFKKKSLYKSATSVEISSFPFTDQVSGRSGGALQKVNTQKECGGNNEIDHMYKINELDTSLKASICRSRQSHVDSVKKVTHSDSHLDQAVRKMERSPETNETDWSTVKMSERNQMKKDLLSKYGVSQTLTTAPHGLQLKESSRTAAIGENDTSETIRNRLRKPKREEKYLFLPKVTPTLGFDLPKPGKERKNTLRLGVIPSGTKSEVTFVNFR